MVLISRDADVDVIAVEYPGYGNIPGPPTDRGLLRNVIAGYKFITETLAIKSTNLIFYGQSMGTGPTTYLAANPDFPIGGLVTEGAFVSGLRLMNKEVKPFFNFLRELTSTTEISSPMAITWAG